MKFLKTMKTYLSKEISLAMRRKDLSNSNSLNKAKKKSRMCPLQGRENDPQLLSAWVSIII